MKINLDVQVVNNVIQVQLDDHHPCQQEVGAASSVCPLLKNSDNDDETLKAWLWEHRRDELLQAIKITVVEESSHPFARKKDKKEESNTIPVEEEHPVPTNLSLPHVPRGNNPRRAFSYASGDDQGQEGQLVSGDLPLDQEVPTKLPQVDSGHRQLYREQSSSNNEHDDDASMSHISKQRLVLLDKISQVQRQYLQSEAEDIVFGNLLDTLLDLMDSEYGFIGEVKFEEPTDANSQGTMYLQTHAITNIAWNDETRAFYEANAPTGLKFYNLDSLFGKVMTTSRPVISNSPKSDPRRCGIPEGHPPLNSFLGVPFFDHGSENLAGMVGIANRPGGYTQADVEFLEPFVVTCCNLIQAYKAVRERKMLINTLEEKVEERTRALVLANENLEAANRRVTQAAAAQMTHFACMSHEIRTPLNCVIGLSSLLKETELNDMQAESLRMIVASGELLCTIVDDVLDYSKLISGNVDISIRTENLQETLDAVVQAIEFKARAKHLDFQTIYGPYVPQMFETDNQRLQQILYNLLGNAIKFSNEGGAVEFSVNVKKRSEASEVKSSTEYTFELPTSIETGAAVSETEHTSVSGLHDGLSVGSSPEAGMGDSDDPEASSPPTNCPFHRSSTPTEVSTPPSTVTNANSASRCPFTKSASSVARQGGTSEPSSKSSTSEHVLQFVIKDYGCGIDSANFHKVFQPFLQANEDTTRLYGGTGLGLSITARLVARLGGTISVDSELGQWTKFTVEIPCENALTEKDLFSRSFENGRIVYVNGENRADDLRMLECCKMPIHTFDSIRGLDKLPTRDKCGNFFFCFINEDMFDAEIFRRFLENHNAALLTFGPNHIVTGCRHRFRSLARLLPCVLMQHLSSCLDESSGDKKQEEELVHVRKEVDVADLQILIAEDNIVNQKVLTQVLKRLKVPVEHIDIANNGQEAVNMTADKDYDFVFMDMQMPIMDGLEACRIIKDRAGGAAVEELKLEGGTMGRPHVVFVTANVSSDFEEQAKAVGGDGFISKPFNLQTIEQFFHTCVR